MGCSLTENSSEFLKSLTQTHRDTGSSMVP